MRGPWSPIRGLLIAALGTSRGFLMRLTRMEGRLAVLSARGFARRFTKRLTAKLRASLRDLTVGEQSLPWARSIMIADHARFKVPAFAVLADVFVC